MLRSQLHDIERGCGLCSVLYTVVIDFVAIHNGINVYPGQIVQNKTIERMSEWRGTWRCDCEKETLVKSCESLFQCSLLPDMEAMKAGTHPEYFAS